MLENETKVNSIGNIDDIHGKLPCLSDENFLRLPITLTGCPGPFHLTRDRNSSLTPENNSFQATLSVGKSLPELIPKWTISLQII